MFSTFLSFHIDKILNPFFINPNVSFVPSEIFADGSSISLNQHTASTDESSPAVEPIPLVPSSPFVHLHISHPSILLLDYVCNSAIITYDLALILGWF